MNTGKTVFAQLMTMLPEYEFDKCVARYKGYHRVRNFSCRDHFYVIEKGYVDFFRLFNLIHQKRVFFVTRAKDNMVYEVVSSNKVNKRTGVFSDEYVRLTGYKSSREYPEKFRMVTYEDFSTGVVYRFITNNFELQSITISELYRERWNVELFKWIKQHLKIKSFNGTTRKKFMFTLMKWLVISQLNLR
ncbi:MAG TPA: DUF4372 domain-containing protein, partial [Bacteroidales bacterium]